MYWCWGDGGRSISTSVNAKTQAFFVAADCCWFDAACRCLSVFHNNNNNNKEAEKKLKYKSLCIEIQWMWNLKCTIIPVITGATGIVTRSLKEKFGTCTRKTFDRFTTKDSYTWNITHNTESTAVWNLKPERWGSPLVQEKYQAEKACDKRHPYCIIIIIIIIL